ncbi:MAG: hypothetical protein HKN43_00550 [Rhodothermales bacterium]|nr:hypothetical protein [Rhodothermales bacterium]
MLSTFMTVAESIAALDATARKWIDVEYPPRVQAMNATLALDNNFTPEAIHFAVNQQMNQITSSNLESWLSGRSVDRDVSVGVLNPGNVPMADLQDLIAAVLLGVSYRGSLSSRSPHLLSAFVEDLRSSLPQINIEFVEKDQVLKGVDKVIATGTTSTLDAMKNAIARAGLDPEDVLLRGPGFGVAILNGSESEEQLERLAEDILMHDGAGCRSIAVVWTPAGSQPDALLDAMARFRAVFPCAPGIPGRVEMQRAYLAAIEYPHAYSDDKSFLVSKGPPDIQQPGHVRWSEYESRDEVWDWIGANDDEIQVIVEDGGGGSKNHRTAPLGSAQRPELGWLQSGCDVIDFLAS